MITYKSENDSSGWPVENDRPKKEDRPQNHPRKKPRKKLTKSNIRFLKEIGQKIKIGGNASS